MIGATAQAILSRRSMAAPNAAQQESYNVRESVKTSKVTDDCPLIISAPAVSAPLARNTDPSTSHDAAARAAHSVAKHEAWIFDAIHQAGERGATAKEISAATKLSDVQVNRRLAAMGRRNIIERSPLTDCSGFESRNGCAVWWKT